MYREKWMVDGWDGPTPLMTMAVVEDGERRPRRWTRLGLNGAGVEQWVDLSGGEGVWYDVERLEADVLGLLPVGGVVEWVGPDGVTLQWGEVVRSEDGARIGLVAGEAPLRVKVVGLEEMLILPPPRGVCQECARDHPPEDPHDAQSLQYQFTFRQREGRWPSWADAAAHCSPEVQEAWRLLLEGEHGVVWDDPARVGGG